MTQTDKIDALLASLSRSELSDVWCFIRALRRAGQIRPAAANDWGRRIVARWAANRLGVAQPA